MALAVRVSEHLERLALKRVVGTGDGHPLREVLRVGSVWRCPSTNSSTIGWSSLWNIGVETGDVTRLIQKWLKAGVMEEGEWTETKEGSPQGAVISPILANLYLHYVLDLWVEQWRKKQARGDVIVVRYADDAVLGFEHRTEAERFLKEFRERLGSSGWNSTPRKRA